MVKPIPLPRKKGIRSNWGTKTETKKSEEISLSNIQPQIEFGSDGIFLPSSNKRKIQFLYHQFEKGSFGSKKGIFPNKVGQFLEAEQAQE